MVNVGLPADARRRASTSGSSCAYGVVTSTFTPSVITPV